jgi:hypothetical protein
MTTRPNGDLMLLLPMAVQGDSPSGAFIWPILVPARR